MKSTGPLRVLVIDDSPYVRKVLRGILEADPLVGVVDTAPNGQIALQKALRSPPDLVTLDLRMPAMDGFTFLRLFRSRSQAAVLVVSSYADLENVERALALGATGFIAKPTDLYGDLKSVAEEFRLKLRQTLRPSGFRGTHQNAHPSVRAGEPAPDFPVVALGSSSGGPPTLQYLLSGLPGDMGAAVLIAQHMPPGFTRSLAERLDALLPYPIREARDQEWVCPGEALLGPGGAHLALRRRGNRVAVSLEDPAGAVHVPSVDRLLETAAAVFGHRLTAVILTGMGKDGAEGVRAVKEHGGRVIAESEETAAAHGMPRQAIATGCVDEVLSLPAIAVRLIRLVRPQPIAEAQPGEDCVVW